MVVITGIAARWALESSWCRSRCSIPIVLVLCVVGAFALNNTMSNVYVLLAFGVLGYAMVKVGLPLAPFILGVILGDQIEINLIRSIMTDPDPWLFVTRPISGALLAAAVRRSCSRCGSIIVPKRRGAYATGLRAGGRDGFLDEADGQRDVELFHQRAQIRAALEASPSARSAWRSRQRRRA